MRKLPIPTEGKNILTGSKARYESTPNEKRTGCWPQHETIGNSAKESTGKQPCNLDNGYSSNSVNRCKDVFNMKFSKRTLAVHSRVRSNISSLRPVFVEPFLAIRVAVDPDTDLDATKERDHGV